MSYTITNDSKSSIGSNSLIFFPKIRRVYYYEEIVISTMYILGRGGAGAYISHANTQTHNNTSYNNSNKKNADPDQQKSNNSDADSNKDNSSQDDSAKSSSDKDKEQSKKSSSSNKKSDDQ